MKGGQELARKNTQGQSLQARVWTTGEGDVVAVHRKTQDTPRCLGRKKQERSE